MRERRGFTLTEMLVVILIIGILAALGIPQYNKTIESAKADNAAAVLRQIGSAQRMFQIHRNFYADGEITAACNAAACMPDPNPCNLVACRYLAAQDWAGWGFKVFVFNPADASPCDPGNAIAGAQYVACVKRCSDAGVASCTQKAPYMNWGYAYRSVGTVDKIGGAP